MFQREYKIDAELGPLMVAYKETPHVEAFEEFDFERKIANQNYFVKLCVRLKPNSDQGQKSNLKITAEDLKPFQINAIKKGITLLSITLILNFF